MKRPSRIARMRPVLAALALFLSVVAPELIFAGAAAAETPRSRVKLKLPAEMPAPGVAPTAAKTRCATCHTTAAWGDVRFAHDRTGFLLRGLHQKVSCKSCHRVDFKRTIPTACAGCHRDAHAGEFGQHCEGCHNEESWRTTFTADAHRKGNFPLSGRHALIPCTECHRDVASRGFGRVAVDCYGCHQADYQRAATRSVDHVAAGFSTDCRSCHNPWRFAPATFPAHDRCFAINSGPHTGIRCLSCHSRLPAGGQATGMCTTGTGTCTTCHEHLCTKSDTQHRNVSGYQCKDQKCYECHRLAR